jgi:hypothetical protein
MRNMNKRKLSHTIFDFKVWGVSLSSTSEKANSDDAKISL